MLRAIILIGLVGQAAAFDCVVGTGLEELTDCTEDECWTQTDKVDPAVITYGCGGETSDGAGDTCNTGSGNCALCQIDGCNEPNKCWVGTVTDVGVVSGGKEVCTKDKCWTQTDKTNADVITSAGCGGETSDGAGDTCNTGSGNCALCQTDGCNEPTNKCWVGTVTDGVVSGGKEVCTKDKCWTHTDKTNAAVITYGCGGESNDGAALTCNTVTGDCVVCTANVANGCNVPIQICFVGSLAMGKAGQCTSGELECFTKTLTAGAKDFGCGKCVPGNDHTCSADAAVMDCQNIVPAGCNEPPRFQCIVGVDKPDTTAAEDCMPNPYTALHSCTKIVKSVDGEDDVITKACDVCPAKGAEVAGEKCYACDKTGCNSASGLFSVLALTLAVIYQLA